MDSSAGSKAKMGRLRQLVLCTCVVVCIGLLIPYSPILDTATLAYREFVGDLFGVGGPRIDVQARAKDASVDSLKEMLTYANPEARAFAARALVYKGERAALPNLIQSLNDTRPFREPYTRVETSLAEISKTAITDIVKAQIAGEPENIGFLIPLFTAAERGSQSERRSVVEIFGELKEPLARQLMVQISAERDGELGKISETSLAQMDSLGSGNFSSSEIDDRQVRIAFGCALMMVLLFWSIFSRFREGLQTRAIFLSALPLALLGSYGAVIISDHSKGEISEQRVDAAIRDQDLISLRTMNYHDYTTYPGDSYVAQRLLRICNEDVIRCLILLPSVQTTDNVISIAMSDTRKRWILARFVAASLGTPKLAALATNSDAEIRATVTTVLGRLGVRNEHITASLTRLSQDPNERVRKMAEGALARVAQYPVWLGYTSDR